MAIFKALWIPWARRAGMISYLPRSVRVTPPAFKYALAATCTCLAADLAAWSGCLHALLP